MNTIEIGKLDFDEKYQWKREYSGENDVNVIKNLIADYMKGSVPFYERIVPYADIEKLHGIHNEIFEDYKKEVELVYLASVYTKLAKTKKLSDKMSIWKFLYFDKPIREIKGKISGKKFSLYDLLPHSDKYLFHR